MMDLTGRTFGQLTVLEAAPPEGRHKRWRVRCACGRETTPLQHHLLAGATRSCGTPHRTPRNDAPPGCRWLPLTRGGYALVDAADYPALAKHNWQLLNNGYAARAVLDAAGRQHGIYLHREILGVPPGVLVDHRNLDRLDCRRANLRRADRAGSNQNKPGWKEHSSCFKGVCWDTRGGRWRADIYRGRPYPLGYFESEEAAARAYDVKARELFGEFAYLNFPDAGPEARP